MLQIPLKYKMLFGFVKFVMKKCVLNCEKRSIFTRVSGCNSPALPLLLYASFSLPAQFSLKHAQINLTPPFLLSKTLWFIHKVSSKGVCGCVSDGWTAPSTDLKMILHLAKSTSRLKLYNLNMFGAQTSYHVTAKTADNLINRQI